MASVDRQSSDRLVYNEEGSVDLTSAFAAAAGEGWADHKSAGRLAVVVLKLVVAAVWVHELELESAQQDAEARKVASYRRSFAT